MTKKPRNRWIEVMPYGLIGGMISEASAMVFREKKGGGQFSVWLSELQSSIAVSQSLSKEQPFDFVQKILKVNKILPKECFFTETKDDRDIVVITFDENNKSLKFFADEVISFCILNNCRFFCSKDFLNKSRHRDLPRRFTQKIMEKKPFYLN